MGSLLIASQRGRGFLLTFSCENLYLGAILDMILENLVTLSPQLPQGGSPDVNKYRSF